MSIISLLYCVHRWLGQEQEGKEGGGYLRINSALYTTSSRHCYTENTGLKCTYTPEWPNTTISCFDLQDLENRDHSYSIMQGIVNTKVKHKCVQRDVQSVPIRTVFTLVVVQLYRHAQSLLITSRHYWEIDHCVDFKDKSDDSLAGKNWQGRKRVFEYI